MSFISIKIHTNFKIFFFRYLIELDLIKFIYKFQVTFFIQNSSQILAGVAGVVGVAGMAGVAGVVGVAGITSRTINSQSNTS